MTPAGELRDAARIVRDRESKATSPEWWTPETVTGPSHTWFDAEWIAMLNPGVSDHLIALFLAAAKNADDIFADVPGALIPSILASAWWQPLLALAREIRKQAGGQS